MTSIDWARIIENIATITVPLALYMLANRDRAKRENEERDEQNRRENDRRHEENKKVLEDLLIERMFFPPHEHTERSGPLTAEGVRRLPYRGGKDR
jgi:hypothetical protein